MDRTLEGLKILNGIRTNIIVLLRDQTTNFIAKRNNICSFSFMKPTLTGIRIGVQSIVQLLTVSNYFNNIKKTMVPALMCNDIIQYI